MGTESTGESEVTVQLPADLVEWLDERAEDEAIPREELLVQLLSAYRTTVETSDEIVAGDDGIAVAIDDAVGSELEERLRAVETQLEAQAGVEERISSLQEEFDEKIEDVRNRVLQLRDAIRDRAPADHSHERLEEFDAISDRLEDVETAVDRLDDEMANVEDRTVAVETSLEEAESKLDRIARVVVALRKQIEGESSKSERTLDRIKHTAALEGIDVAKCDDCGRSVRIALLTEPACPHCEMTTSDLVPPESFFGKAKLLGTDAPALEEGDE